MFAALGAGLESARAAAPRTYTGEQIVASLSKQRFVRKDVIVQGPLDFRSLRNVNHPFVCLDCVFNGPVSASDTTFERSFDVSGARFLGQVSMNRATFLGPAVFGLPPGNHPTVFLERSSFSLAQFASVASFEAAQFIGDTDFTLARFEKNAIFSSVFSKQSTFTRASFAGVADFRSAQFGDEADFEEAEFTGLADFSLAVFVREAGFKRVRFEGRGSFFGSQFRYVAKNDFSALFNRATSVGVLDFSSAQFLGKTTFRGISGHIVLFARTTFYARRAVVFDDDAVADSLVMSVHTADDAIESEDRVHVLQLIEASAKARNDLGVANDAHYDIASLQSKGYWWPWRILDQAFYGGIAGYFVRPFRPLATVVVLVVFLAVLRTLRRRAVASPRSPQRRSWRAGLLASARAYAHRFVTEVLDGLARIGRRGADADPPSLTNRLEVFAYRVLVVCALLGFANSNPTLRQMFDALR
jgi:Pentapeptide repeats (9 copies)